MVKEVSQKKIAAKPPSLVDLYSIYDPLPVPEAFESNSDAAWALWEEITSKLSNEPQLERPPLSAAPLPIQKH